MNNPLWIFQSLKSKHQWFIVLYFFSVLLHREMNVSIFWILKIFSCNQTCLWWLEKCFAFRKNRNSEWEPKREKLKKIKNKIHQFTLLGAYYSIYSIFDTVLLHYEVKKRYHNRREKNVKFCAVVAMFVWFFTCEIRMQK